MTINISHRGFELTPAIKDYVEEKMQSLTKYSDVLQHMDVEVGLTNGHHQKGDIYMCKVVLEMEGKTMNVAREEEDLYKAIDKVRDHLRVELTDWKRRQEDQVTRVDTEIVDVA